MDGIEAGFVVDKTDGYGVCFGFRPASVARLESNPMRNTRNIGMRRFGWSLVVCLTCVTALATSGCGADGWQAFLDGIIEGIDGNTTNEGAKVLAGTWESQDEGVPLELTIDEDGYVVEMNDLIIDNQVRTAASGEEYRLTSSASVTGNVANILVEGYLGSYTVYTHLNGTVVGDTFTAQLELAEGQGASGTVIYLTLERQ